MLDNLLDIEVAYSLIKETSDSEDPLDSYYKKLKTHIKVITWSIISGNITASRRLKR